MSTKHCVLIVIAVTSILMPAGVFCNSMLRHKFEKRYSSNCGLDLPLQGTNSRLVKRWTNSEPNEQLILAKLEHEQDSDWNSKKPSATAPITFLDNGYNIYDFEKKQIAYMQDWQFFMNSGVDNRTQDLKGEEHNRVSRAYPYSRRAYSSVGGHSTRSPNNGESQTLSAGRRSFRRYNRPKPHRSSETTESESTNQKLLDYLIKTVREEQSKEIEPRAKRSAKYQKIDKRKNLISNLFDERKNFFKRSIEVPYEKMYEENGQKTSTGRPRDFHRDLPSIFKRSVDSDSLNVHDEKYGSFKSVGGRCSLHASYGRRKRSLHASYGRRKRSANFGDVIDINDPGCNCFQNEKSAMRRKRSIRFSINEKTHGTEDGLIALDTCSNNQDNRDFAKRSTAQENEAKMTSNNFEKSSKESIERAQDFEHKIISAVEKCCDLNPIVAEMFKESRLLLHRNENDISRDHGTDVINAGKHRIQKRRVNLVMNDPTFEDLGLNPVQVENCVNEMLEVPGFTEQGLDWQILGDHFRYYFTKMKDLTESYGFGLFSAVRELTNFHRWMKSGQIHGPYMSGSFTPYYYQRRSQNGQPSLSGYQEKPVFGRTGPYSNFPEYEPPQAKNNKQKINDYAYDYPASYMDEYEYDYSEY